MKADGVAEEVPGAMEESCPGPDLHLAPGSFGEDSGWGGRGAQPFSKLGCRHQV